MGPCGLTIDVTDIRWWALLDLRHRLLGGPPSTFSRWMVGALGSPAPPPKGVIIDIFTIDDGRSWISGTTSQGVRHRRFHVGWWALLDLRHRLPEGHRQRFYVAWWALLDLHHRLLEGHRRHFHIE
jgi:hypothetical protein